MNYLKIVGYSLGYWVNWDPKRPWSFILFQFVQELFAKYFWLRRKLFWVCLILLIIIADLGCRIHAHYILSSWIFFIGVKFVSNPISNVSSFLPLIISFILFFLVHWGKWVRLLLLLTRTFNFYYNFLFFLFVQFFFIHFFLLWR